MSEKIWSHIKDFDAIVWDWNGTLLNDLDIAVAAEKELLNKYNLPQISKEKRRDIFHLPIRSYYEAIGFNLSEIPFENLAHEWLEGYEARLAEASIFNEAQELLNRIQNTEKKQSILSAAPEKHLQKIVKEHSIDSYFDDIYGLADIYAKSKLERGEDLKKAQSLEGKKVIMLGDTDHDAEVAQHLGFDFLIIADGHQSPKKISETTSKILESRF